MLGQVGGQGLGVVGQDEPDRVGRDGIAEGRQDGLGVGLDELQPGVALAGPVQGGRDLGPGRPRGGAPELDDRHDRDIDHGGGVGSGVGSAVARRGTRRRRRAGIRGWRRRPRRSGCRARPAGWPEGSLPNPSWSPVMGRTMAAASSPSTATSGARFTDGVCQRCDDAPSGRADGASGKAEDGGPDRIRTGDLQRDRLACWAATPRVQLRRGRTIAEAPALVRRPPYSVVHVHPRHRPPFRHRHPADRRDAPGDGRGRGRRRRPGRRPDRQRPRGARRRAAGQGRRPVRGQRHDGQPRRPDGPPGPWPGAHRRSRAPPGHRRGRRPRGHRRAPAPGP